MAISDQATRHPDAVGYDACRYPDVEALDGVVAVKEPIMEWSSALVAD